MSLQVWVAVVGSCAGFCTTVAFVPQVWRIWKQGGNDLSYAMLLLYILGVMLWLTYGLLLHAWAIIIANFVTGLLLLLCLVLKWWKALPKRAL